MSIGLDFFGLYSSEVAELLAQDEDLEPFADKSSHLDEQVNGVDCEKVNTGSSYPARAKNNFTSSASLFSTGVAAFLSEFRKERLKVLLRQSVFTLSHEVDEVTDAVISLCRVRSCVRHKDKPQPQHPHKKLKMASPSSIDDDIQFLLESDSSKVEELLNEHANEFFVMLRHMEQKLEELLNSVMTTCRAMTPNEKQQLCKWIKNLPPKNVDRVIEILGHNETSRRNSGNEVSIDLDGEDPITLWRLYFCVAAMENAKRL